MIGQPLSEQEILALPPLIDLETAGRALTLGRSTTYRLARVGELPVPVVRVGPRSLRVRAADLRRFLLTAGEPIE